MNDTFFGRLSDLIARPGRLMDNVGERPRWWQPGLVILVLVAAFAWLTAPIAKPEQVEMMRGSRITSMMTEAQIQEQYDAALNLDPTTRAIEAVSAGFFAWVAIILAGFVVGFFVRMAGGKGSFRQALGIVSWAALISSGLGVLLKLPLVLATESMYQVNLGLAALMPDATPGDPLFQVLVVYGDFPTWWWLALMVIGFQRVFAVGRGAAAASVILPWALLSLVPLGITLLFM